MIDKEFRTIIRKIKARIAQVPAPTDYEWERKAFDYACWLVTRDGIGTPQKLASWERKNWRAVWSGVHSNTRTRQSKSGDTVAIFEKRICAVEWGLHEGPIVRVELPNWDWQPEVIDTSESDDYLAMAA